MRIYTALSAASLAVLFLSAPRFAAPSFAASEAVPGEILVGLRYGGLSAPLPVGEVIGSQPAIGALRVRLNAGASIQTAINALRSFRA